MLVAEKAGSIATMSRLPVRARVRIRWAVALLAGLAAGLLVAPRLGLAAALLSGWAALAFVIVVWVLVQIWPMGAAETREHATAEDPGRRIARLIATVGSVSSLAAVVVVAVQARHASGAESYMLAGVAVLSVAASWALIQTDYLLHYARVYYERGEGGEPRRGILFNQDDDPQYTDFAYFSVGLGMTYQVADTNVTRNEVRRIVIAQTLIGYLFGAGIMATVINLITGLG